MHAALDLGLDDSSVNDVAEVARAPDEVRAGLAPRFHLSTPLVYNRTRHVPRAPFSANNAPSFRLIALAFTEPPEVVGDGLAIFVGNGVGDEGPDGTAG